jgi:endonuclease/exonuclease/phosphatase family metal-dependent hydrolase
MTRPERTAAPATACGYEEAAPVLATPARRPNVVAAVDPLDRYPASSFRVATFNAHAGVDGWGRPYDVVAACQLLDADIVVLEENWAPAQGPSLAARVSTALGYERRELTLASGRLAGPHPDADERWMRSFDWRGRSHAIFLDSERPFAAQTLRSPRFASAQPGSWGVAVLSRLPVTASAVIDLGRLARDRARRAALALFVEAAGIELVVVGVHMSHLTYGAPRQFLRLARAIRATFATMPVVLAGDMNLWGPPVRLFFPGWRRAVRARTWPAWRPHSQVDHVLVRGALRVIDAKAFGPVGSDHRPLRVTLAPEGAR